jgi:hypothetical protein
MNSLQCNARGSRHLRPSPEGAWCVLLAANTMLQNIGNERFMKNIYCMKFHKKLRIRKMQDAKPAIYAEKNE